MDFNSVLPELVLSKNCARYLLTRNANEKALLRKKYCYLEKAKTKEEKAFRREKDLLLQRKVKAQDIQQTWSGRVTSEYETENKWEVSSDTTLNAIQRKKHGSLMSRKASHYSSHESILTHWNHNSADSEQIMRSSTRLKPTSGILPPIITTKQARK